MTKYDEFEFSLESAEESLKIALTAKQVAKALETCKRCSAEMEEAIDKANELKQVIDDMDPDMFNIDDTVLAFPF